MGEDIREMSFQAVLDNILKPAGVHVGGYPEEIFTDLTEEERDQWNCNICYLLVRGARECDNKHLFCHTCIFAWSMTYGENSQRCPMCRVEQRDYKKNIQVARSMGDKRVKCPEDGCTFRSPLHVFLLHSHGRERFSDDHVDLESLRPARPPGSRLLILPGGIPVAGLVGLVAGGGRSQRASAIRDQLQQGRVMIHQMMMLLHLEMQLRQQALVSYSQAQDTGTRMRRLDEVLALNEQLNEVGTILSNLLSTPLARAGQAAAAIQGHVTGTLPDDNGNRLTPRRTLGNSSPGVRQGPGASPRPSTSTNNEDEDGDDDDDEDDADDQTESVSSSSSSSIVSRFQLSRQLNSRGISSLGGGVQSRGGFNRELPRRLRRSEIRQQLRTSNPSISDDEDGSSSEAPPSRLSERDSVLALPLGGADRESNISVTLQRLDDPGPSGVVGRPANSANRNQRSSSSLPPLMHQPPLVHQPPLTHQTSTSVGRSIETLTSEPERSPRLPTGSTIHQRALEGLGHTSGVTDDTPSSAGPGVPEGDSRLSSTFAGASLQQRRLSEVRPNSIARLSAGTADPLPLRSGPRVTSQGITASGAIYSTSADTPSTRAATLTVPLTPAAVSPRLSVSHDDVDDCDVAPDDAARTAPGFYAPQRRFRRESVTTAHSSRNRNSATSSAVPPPYVPHRSVSPTRGRSLGRRRRPSDDVIGTSSLRAAQSQSPQGRAGGLGPRGSLPTTPGRLLRSRRRSDLGSDPGNTRQSKNNHGKT